MKKLYFFQKDNRDDKQIESIVNQIDCFDISFDKSIRVSQDSIFIVHRSDLMKLERRLRDKINTIKVICYFTTSASNRSIKLVNSEIENHDFLVPFSYLSSIVEVLASNKDALIKECDQNKFNTYFVKESNESSRKNEVLDVLSVYSIRGSSRPLKYLFEELAITKQELSLLIPNDDADSLAAIVDLTPNKALHFLGDRGYL